MIFFVGITQFRKNLSGVKVFNEHCQLVSDIDRYLVIRLEQALKMLPAINTENLKPSAVEYFHIQTQAFSEAL
jgi:hypothetical protein